MFGHDARSCTPPTAKGYLMRSDIIARAEILSSLSTQSQVQKTRSHSLVPSHRDCGAQDNQRDTHMSNAFVPLWHQQLVE